MKRSSRFGVGFGLQAVSRNADRAGFWRTVRVVAAIGVVVVSGATAGLAQGNPNPGVLPPNSEPHGFAYTEWAVKWLQSALSIPTDQNPFLDPDGRFCQVGQSGSVFFLGNNAGGTTVRSCTVSAGKALLISPGGAFCILGVDADSEEGIRACVEQEVAGLTDVAADVDGVSLQELTRYLVETPLFSFTLPNDNIFGLAPGEYQAILGGYFLMVAPLPPGQHVIHFHDEFPPTSFDVTYLITIDPRSRIRLVPGDVRAF